MGPDRQRASGGTGQGAPGTACPGPQGPAWGPVSQEDAQRGGNVSSFEWMEASALHMGGVTPPCTV